MNGFIYKAVNLSNWKVYIGQTIQVPQKRWYKHLIDAKKGSKLPFHRALKKYGSEMFSFEVIAEVSRNTEKELFYLLDKLETYYIGYYDSINWGYNLTDGGGGHSTRRYLYLEADEEGNLVEVWKGIENSNALQYGSDLANGRVKHSTDDNPKITRVYEDWQRQIVDDTTYLNF